MRLPIPEPKKHDPQREISREVIVPSLSTSEITQISQTVFLPSNPKRADIIFVFGSSDGDWISVAKLYSDKFSDKILVNGRTGKAYDRTGKPLAHIIREALLSQGIPSEAILVQDQSTNTLEDVRLGKGVLDEHHLSPASILFVSKSHHSGRAFRTLRKFFPQANISVLTYNASYNGVRVSSDCWWMHPTAKAKVYGEYVRIRQYSQRGDIAS